LISAALVDYSVDNSKNLQRLKKRLESDVGKAIADYNMIEQGDTILVCISGGKDYWGELSSPRELGSAVILNDFCTTALETSVVDKAEDDKKKVEEVAESVRESFGLMKKVDPLPYSMSSPSRKNAA